MTDVSTERALKSASRRRAAIPMVLGALLGLLLRATVQFDPARSLWLLIEPWAIAAPSVETWARSNILGGLWASWASAPLFIMLALGIIARTRLGKEALEWMVRDPPWFVSSCLEAERRRTMLNLEGEPLPLVGRQDLLSDLDVPDRWGPSFAWRMVVGPTGIGKTRLGIEWLEKMRERRWDVGVVALVDLQALRGWQARKPTALLIDDARRRWDNRLGELLVCLADGSAVERRVRVLVVDQSALAIEMGLAESHERLMGLHQGDSLRVPALSEEDMIALQVEAGSAPSDAIVSAAAGRPRAALIMLRSAQSDCYGSALHRWARQMLPAIMDDSAPFPLAIGGPLLLSCLAGPIPVTEVRRACGDVDVVPLTRFYDESDASRLDELLPLLEPDDLALALVLQLLPRIDGERRTSLVELAMSWNISTFEDRLSTLSRWQGDSWTATIPDSEEIIWLRWLQERFDGFAADRVEALRLKARQLLGTAQEASDSEHQMRSVRELCDLADSRPFDAEIRTIECVGLSIAIRLFGACRKFDAMEQWAVRLLKLLSLKGKLKCISLDRSLLLGIMAAADHYHQARRPKDLNRWKGHLDRLVESLSAVELQELRPEIASAYANTLHALGLNRQLQDMEAVGARIRDIVGGAPKDLGGAAAAALACTHALCIYGQLSRIADMTRWLNELFELAGRPLFEPEPEMRVLEAAGISDAMGHFGQAKLFEQLEAYGKRLLQLADDSRFSDDLRFHLRVAEGASISMKSYSETGDFASIERWGQVLIAVAEDARFEGNPDIRRRQLHGAVSAAFAYGHAQRLEEMLRWANLGLAVATDSRFVTSSTVQEIASALIVNVANETGEARMFDEMERWGSEVVRIAGTPEFFDNYKIQEAVAQATGNIVVRWAKGGADARTFSRWTTFLARHAQHYPWHPGVQAVASALGMTATEQLLGHFPYGRVECRSRMTAPQPDPGGGRTEGHSVIL